MENAKQSHEVTLIEVGPRDGLQNEKIFVETEKKVEFINALAQTGLTYIEATSFVSPKAIPQLADNFEVFTQIDKPKAVHFSALVPNLMGLNQALKSSVHHISVFTAASESFNQKNINCSIDESLMRIQAVIEEAKHHHLSIRAYISCVLGCPYEGNVSPQIVAEVAERLLKLGVDEISFGDTIGVGTPKQTLSLLKIIQAMMPNTQIAMHFHDTYGQAIGNIYASLEQGIHRFDAAVSGLGGCPYARGASGNVATEDILYLLHGLGIETGVDIYKLVRIGDSLCKYLGRTNQSKVANALLANL